MAGCTDSVRCGGARRGWLGDRPRSPRAPNCRDSPKPVSAQGSVRRRGPRCPRRLHPRGRVAPTRAVRPAGDGFELIAGERRWRAARRAGLQAIPAIVRETGDRHALEQALVENLQRDDLNPLEEAAAYQQMIEDFSMTHEQVASTVGKSRAAVTNTVRLLQLPPSIQRALREEQLSMGHARA